MDIGFIPKPVRQFKPRITRNITWQDFGVGLFMTALSAVILAVSHLEWYGSLIVLFILIIFTIFLLVPWSKKFIGIRPYTYFYRWFLFLFSKKKYNASDLEALIPYEKILSDKSTVKLKNGDEMVIFQVSTTDLSLLHETEQFKRVNSFKNSIRRLNLSHAIFKLNLPTDLNAQSDAVDKKIDNLDIDTKEIQMIQQEILSDIIVESDNYVDKFFIAIYGNSIDLKSNVNIFTDNLRQSKVNPKLQSGGSLETILNYYYGGQLFFTDGKNNTRQLNIDADWIKVKSNKIEYSSGVQTKIFGVYEYPSSIQVGWLNSLNSNPNIDWTMKVIEYSRGEANNKLDKIIRTLEEDLETNSKKASDIIVSDDYFSQMASLSKRLNNDSESLFSTFTMIFIQSESTFELNKLSRKLRSSAEAVGIKLVGYDFLQYAAFGSLLPKNTLDMKKIHSIEMPGISLASAFPFMNKTMNDSSGLFLGYSDSGSPLFFDPNIIDEDRKNHNIVVLGTSGAGKSTLSKKLIAQQVFSLARTIIIDPEREYKKLCESVKGKWLNFGTDKKKGKSEAKINPMQFLMNENDGRGLLGSHLSFLEQFFQTLWPRINESQTSVLRRVLVQTYKNKDINENNSHKKRNPEQFPIIDDIISCLNYMIEDSKNIDDIFLKALRELKIMFMPFEDNTPQKILWNGYSSFDIHDSDFTVLDIHSLTGSTRIRNAQMYLLLKFVNSAMVQNKNIINKSKSDEEDKPLCIVVDEAHLLIDEENTFGLQFLYELVKRARKYKTITIITTQNLRDFVGGTEKIKRKSHAIINQAQYMFLLGSNAGDISDISELFNSIGGLTDAEKTKLTYAQKGEGLLCIGSKERHSIQVSVTKRELDLWEEKIS